MLTKLKARLQASTDTVPRADYDAAIALITDIANAVPKDANSGEYGQTMAGVVLKCRTFLGLKDEATET